jgi:DNA (cytosine-5)-methyltransferase 1
VTAYYNEVDPYAAAWLRNLIAARLIAAGEVDERDIRDVRPSDLAGYRQCHFFAGLGGWSHALRLAGWPDDRAVWTGSCPCQPFSAAGRGDGFADERHLWPAWFHLVRECRPATIFGEQVAAKAADAWIDLVQHDLEGVGYAVGAVPLPAAGIGAPHIRDRLWWVADASGRLAQSEHGGRGAGNAERRRSGAALPPGGAGGVADADGRHAGAEGLQRSRQHGLVAEDGGAGRHGADDAAGPLHGFWRDADWLLCRDGKWRPVEPGTFPLAHGVPCRVGRLRAYGNAIVAPLAAEFVAAWLDCALPGPRSSLAAAGLL